MANVPYKLPKELIPGFGAPGQKPTIPIEIDWSNPLANGLVFVNLFGAGLDLVKRNKSLPIGDAYFNHNGLNCGGSGYASDATADFDKSTDFTIHAGFTPDGTTANTFPTIVSRGDTGSGEWMLRWNVTTNALLLYGAGGGLNVASSSDTVIDDIFQTATIRKFNANDWDLHHNDNYIGIDVAGPGSITSTKDVQFGTGDSTSTRNYEGVIHFVFAWDRKLPEAQRKSITENPYQILKPQIDTFYFTAAADGGITGTGTPQATTATSSATGTVTGVITGAGSPSAATATSNGAGLTLISGPSAVTSETATASGVGLTLITGAASVQTDPAESSATGTIGSAISGAGSPQAENATSSGVGLHLVSGSGSAQATTGTTSGTGLHLVTGSSTSNADTATTSAIGVIGDAVVGSGSTQAESASSTGQGLTLITGTGSAVAETATSSGSGLIVGTITGSTSVQAEAAYVTATGVVLTAITGSASVQAGTATASGTDTDSTTIHPRRVYTVEPENRVYTAEAEDRVYVA